MKMLVSFSVGNFRSFKEIVTLSMVAANIKAKHKELDIENVFKIGKVSLLKSAAIYGANASGKSNLLQAFAFMRNFILHSTEANSESNIEIEPFLLSTANATEPSFFEIIFFIDDIRYRYGFEVSKDRVHAEWLYRTAKREVELFWREGESIDVKSGFKEGKGLEARTRSNALFLSVSDQWNGYIANIIISWFRRTEIISGIQDQMYLAQTVNEMVEQKPLASQIIEFVRRLDLGIANVLAEKQKVSPPANWIQQFNDAPDEVKRLLYVGDWLTTIVKTVHDQYDESGSKVAQIEFDLDKHESEGTKKAFSLSGSILHSLDRGRICIVDELDARLHPLMTRAIIELFNSSRTNPNNAQLIFATHDTNLLDNKLFRRDQIWFTEKDRFGATDLYSLVEYKTNGHVRNDASYEANYIAGRYGAIPFIGNIKQLIVDEHE